MTVTEKQIDRLPARGPDYRLLLSRLEKAIISDASSGKWREVLAREALWRKMPAAGRMQWANLAQMAGEFSTASAVLESILAENPECLEAWEARFEILGAMGAPEERLKALAAAKGFVPAERLRQWAASVQAMPVDGDTDTAVAPFAQLRLREERIHRFMQLFSGREDCFARQWVDKKESKQGYVPVRQPLTPGDVETHLSGRMTFGIYLMMADGRVRTAVLDMDLKKEWRVKAHSPAEKHLIKRERDYLIRRILSLCKESGLAPLVEYSGGKGFHFWFLFDQPVQAAQARQYLENIRGNTQGDVQTFSLEVFPKQVQLGGKGLGNLVKLPLGVHRLSGKRSFFIDCADRGITAQLAFLANVRPAALGELACAQDQTNARKVRIHPRFQAWAAEYPELCTLERNCPPLAQVMTACRNGSSLALREEKTLFQTLGFLKRKQTLLHYLFRSSADYNPHTVDFQISRLRGTPLGCNRIHTLLHYNGDFCRFSGKYDYAHPLLHLPNELSDAGSKCEKAEDLNTALERLRVAILQVERFLK